MISWLDPSVFAAFLSAVAAIAAAVATWRGPLAAAKMAETLRQQSADAQEARRIKLNVFAAVMQERADISAEDSVRAFNLIDLAFSDSITVREAWAELHQALNTAPLVNHVVDERLRRLLREMASDLGLSSKLKQDDFGRVYFPTALAEERNVRRLERAAALARLTGAISPVSNAASNDREDLTDSKWPPKPS